MKFLLKLIPEWLKEEIFRKFVSTKHIYDFNEITVKLAETTEEFKKAFELLHDSYVKKGLMEPHSSGMRCNIHSFLPHNAIVIAVDKNGNVIGTVSIIKDSHIGLPAESIYKPEIEELRSKPGREIIEISALSIAPDFRKHSHTILFLLNKFLYIFSRDYFQSNTLIITIHPDASIFYKALFNFKKMGKVFSYEYVKGALAMLMYMDFSGNYEENLWKNVFKGRKDSLIDYIFYQNDSRIKFPLKIKDDVELRNKKTMLEIIKLAKFDLSLLNTMELSYLCSSLNLDQDDINQLGFGKFRVYSDYRFQKKISAHMRLEDTDLIVKIHNISTGGAYVEIPLPFLENLSKGSIRFQWKGLEFSSQFKIRWINNDISSKLPIGAGIEFTTNQIQFFEEDVKYQKIEKAS